MARVLGVGGVFFKSPDPRKLYDWYRTHLGLHVADDEPGKSFQPADLPQRSRVVWSAFQSTTTYFAPSRKEFMFNLIVDDLDGALRQVAAGGAQIVGEIEEYDYGRFGWFLDPDGNKVELWQPA